MKKYFGISLIAVLAAGLTGYFFSPSSGAIEQGVRFLSEEVDEEGIPVSQAVIDARLKTARSLTIYEINVFHARFIDECMEGLELDEKILLKYHGMLNKRGADREKLQVVEPRDFAGSVCWTVTKDGVLFRFWISLEKQSDTVTDCKIGDRVVYVNVEFVNRLRTVEEKLPELGNRSIKELLGAL